MPKFSPKQKSIIKALTDYDKALDTTYRGYLVKAQSDEDAWGAVFALNYMVETNRRLLLLLTDLDSDEHSLMAFEAILKKIPPLSGDKVNTFFQELHQEILTSEVLGLLLKFYEEAPLTTNETVWKYLSLGLDVSLKFSGAYALLVFAAALINPAVIMASIVLLPLLPVAGFLLTFAACLLLYPNQRTQVHYQTALKTIETGLDAMRKLHENDFSKGITSSITTSVDLETTAIHEITKNRTLQPSTLRDAFFNGSLAEEVNASYSALVLS